jgi:hypothetical protein
MMLFYFVWCVSKPKHKSNFCATTNKTIDSAEKLLLIAMLHLPTLSLCKGLSLIADSYKMIVRLLLCRVKN